MKSAAIPGLSYAPALHQPVQQDGELNQVKASLEG